MNKFFRFLQGRHTAFASMFFLSGTAMHWFHRLDSTYIGFMTALMTFVTGHSIQENYFDKDKEAGNAGNSTGQGPVEEEKN